jgi:hypothetical protein
MANEILFTIDFNSLFPLAIVSRLLTEKCCCPEFATQDLRTTGWNNKSAILITRIAFDNGNSLHCYKYTVVLFYSNWVTRIVMNVFVCILIF